MINGIINVYKEKGYTSHDVVAKLRGILRQKKIGHTGTLDPEAEGVLPVCLGKATKVCGLLTDKDKEYKAVLLLGQTTDTQDTAGTVLEHREVTCTEEQAREAVLEFIGTYQQIPPMYSALKVNGKKLCDLARAGIEVERKSREVTIFDIEIEEVSLPRIRMKVHCSKGTYIRTLCHDIGARLNCGGCMESLLRTRVERFSLEGARTLSEIEQQVLKAREEGDGELAAFLPPGLILPVDTVFSQYPQVTARPEAEKLLYNGNALHEEWIEEWNPAYEAEPLRVYDQAGCFIGLYQYDRERKDIRPIKIFME